MNIIIYSTIFLMSNIIVPEEGTNIASIGTSLAPPLKHPTWYVKGEVNEKGQVLTDEVGRTRRYILHREALRLFHPTITIDFRHQGLKHGSYKKFQDCMLKICCINLYAWVNGSRFILKYVYILLIVAFYMFHIQHFMLLLWY